MRTHFEGATESIHKNRKEDQCTTAIKAACIVRQVVENARNDETQDKVAKDGGKEETEISLKTLEATADTHLNLHWNPIEHSVSDRSMVKEKNRTCEIV